jgi:hypothetical protein
MSLHAIVHDAAAVWERAAPATPATIAQLAAAVPALPREFLAFLALSGGGCGDLGVAPGWFQLWPADELVSLHEAYAVASHLPGYVGFGSNGGGELLAFAPDGRIVMVPCVPMHVADAVEVAPTFAAMLHEFGRVAPGG